MNGMHLKKKKHRTFFGLPSNNNISIGTGMESSSPNYYLAAVGFLRIPDDLISHSKQRICSSQNETNSFFMLRG